MPNRREFLKGAVMFLVGLWIGGQAREENCDIAEVETKGPERIHIQGAKATMEIYDWRRKEWIDIDTARHIAAIDFWTHDQPVRLRSSELCIYNPSSEVLINA